MGNIKTIQEIYKYEYMAFNRHAGISFEQTIKPDNFVIFLSHFYKGYFVNKESQS